jgi:hypothetical protein
MARNVCRISGVALLLLGLIGFAWPTGLGLHLTPIHNIVNLLTGLIALYVSFATRIAAARVFCLLFGFGYLLLASAGLVAPGLVASMLGHGPLTARELTRDNAVHVLLGALFLIAGWRAPKAVSRPA